MIHDRELVILYLARYSITYYFLMSPPSSLFIYISRYTFLILSPFLAIFALESRLQDLISYFLYTVHLSKLLNRSTQLSQWQDRSNRGAGGDPSPEFGKDVNLIPIMGEG